MRLQVVTKTVSLQHAIQAAFLSPEAYPGQQESLAESSLEETEVKTPSRPDPPMLLSLTSCSSRTAKLLQDDSKKLGRHQNGQKWSVLDMPAQLVPSVLLGYLNVVDFFRASTVSVAFRDAVRERGGERLQDLALRDFSRPPSTRERERSRASRCLRSRQMVGGWPEAFVACLRSPNLSSCFRNLDIRGIPPQKLNDKAMVQAISRMPNLQCLVVDDGDWSQANLNMKNWVKRLHLLPDVLAVLPHSDRPDRR